MSLVYTPHGHGPWLIVLFLACSVDVVGLNFSRFDNDVEVIEFMLVPILPVSLSDSGRSEGGLRPRTLP
jgi:hypothetical protein